MGEPARLDIPQYRIVGHEPRLAVRVLTLGALRPRRGKWGYCTSASTV
jgi:hypothetical protein